MANSRKEEPHQTLSKLFLGIDVVILHIEEFVLSYSVLFLAVLLVGNIISRAVFKYGLFFVEEMCESTIIIVTYFGLGYCTRKARHIRMSAVYDALGPKTRKTLIILISIITGFIMFMMAYWALGYTIQIGKIGNVTPKLRIPVYLIYCLVPVGFFLSGLEYVLAVYKNLKDDGVFLSVEIPDIYEDESQICQIPSGETK